jgi:flagellar motor switch protein FliN
METQNQPLFWLNKIKKTLIEKDEMPLMKQAAHFSFEDFSKNLKEAFDVDFNITSSSMMWRSKDDLLDGIGENIVSTAINIAPLSSKAYFVINKNDIKKLTNSLMAKKSQENIISEDIVEEGFFHFLVINILQNLENEKLFKNLSFSYENEKIPNEDSLCIDVKISTKANSSWGRIVIPMNLKNSWNKHFLKSPSIISDKIKENLELSVTIEGGYTVLNLNELKKLKKGDFVFLDKSSNLEKPFVLRTQCMALFLANLEDDKIKIKDFAHYEEEVYMENNEIIDESIEDTMEANNEIAKSSKPTSIKEMPIKLTIEMASFKMTLEKLLKIQPGNFLDIPISLDNNVNLTVNGQVIGKAELVYLEDSVGVRILEIGK